MKVLFVIDGLGTGGSERSLSAMLPTLRRAGIEPIVACSHYRPRGVHGDVVAQDVDVRVLPESRFSVGSSLFDSFITRARALRRIICTEHPALVHTTLPQANLVGRVAAAGTGVPVMSSLVNTRYGPERLRDPNVRVWKARLLQLIEAASACLLADHFHAVTHAVKAAAVTDLRIQPERITVVERGRDPERLGMPVCEETGVERRRQAREKLGLGKTDEVLLNAGRQEHQKGQAFLLKAFERLLHARPNVVLLVAGRRGHASANLGRLRSRPALERAEREDRLRFLGHRDDVPELLAAADVFVFPSLYEGIGGAALEAMALGLPVVASDIAPMREVLEAGGNALLAPPADPEALREAIRTLLEDPGRRQAFGQRSRAIFEERFTLERNAMRMAALCYQVAGAYA